MPIQSEMNRQKEGNKRKTSVWAFEQLIVFFFPNLLFAFFCLGRIISIFTKSSSGKLIEELEVMLTVNKFYRYFNVSLY